MRPKGVRLKVKEGRALKLKVKEASGSWFEILEIAGVSSTNQS
jgi:hypothetical protein